jgi:hypothetical protein
MTALWLAVLSVVDNFFIPYYLRSLSGGRPRRVTPGLRAERISPTCPQETGRDGTN